MNQLFFHHQNLRDFGYNEGKATNAYSGEVQFSRLQISKFMQHESKIPSHEVTLTAHCASFTIRDILQKCEMFSTCPRHCTGNENSSKLRSAAIRALLKRFSPPAGSQTAFLRYAIIPWIPRHWISASGCRVFQLDVLWPAFSVTGSTYDCSPLDPTSEMRWGPFPIGHNYTDA